MNYEVEVEMNWRGEDYVFRCEVSADPGEPMTRDCPGSLPEFILGAALIERDDGAEVDVTDLMSAEEFRELEQLAEEQFMDEGATRAEERAVDRYFDSLDA